MTAREMVLDEISQREKRYMKKKGEQKMLEGIVEKRGEGVCGNAPDI